MASTQKQSQVPPSPTNVFKCPTCGSFFTSSTRLPLTLPCGHVICKSCLFSSPPQCPLDHSPYSRDHLQKCQAILDYLPSLDKDFVCKKHGTKRIKYMCEYDNEFFCSLCLELHSKTPHKSHLFVPNKEKMFDEIEFISKRVTDKQRELNEENQRLNECKNKLSEYTREEIKKLNDEIDKMISSLNEMKILFEEKIKNLFKYQLEEIDEGKLNISKQVLILESIESLINNFTSNYKTKMNLVYENIVDDKSKIIYQWEQYLKSVSSLSFSLGTNYIINNLAFPKLQYDTSTFNSLTIIKFDSVPYVKKKEETSNQNLNFRTESTKENSNHNSSRRSQSKIAMRKGSDPTTKLNRQFLYDVKTENKPVLINNSKISSPYINTNNNEKNNSSNNNKSNNRKSVSLKYRDNILMTN